MLRWRARAAAARQPRGQRPDRAARRQLAAAEPPARARPTTPPSRSRSAAAAPLDLRRERARLRPARGLAALPARFGWALIGLLLAALVFLFARGRRLGPPEPERRELPPPRRAYVDALAATMARGKAREQAVAPVREEARRAARPARAGCARTRRRRGMAEAGARAGLGKTRRAR